MGYKSRSWILLKRVLLIGLQLSHPLGWGKIEVEKMVPENPHRRKITKIIHGPTPQKIKNNRPEDKGPPMSSNLRYGKTSDLVIDKE